MKCYPNFKFLLFYRAVAKMLQTRNALLVSKKNASALPDFLSWICEKVAPQKIQLQLLSVKVFVLSNG